MRFGRVGASGCLDTTTTALWATIFINSRMLATGVQGRRSRLVDSARLISIIRILFVMSGFLLLGVVLVYTLCNQGGSEVTNLSKVLPDLFLFVTFRFPLLPNDLGNVRIVQTWVATDNVLLMVLSIEDERYKEVSD